MPICPRSPKTARCTGEEVANAATRGVLYKKAVLKIRNITATEVTAAHILNKYECTS